jgi:hypothetical protein
VLQGHLKEGDELRVDCAEGAEELNFTPVKAEIALPEADKAIEAPKKTRVAKPKADKKSEE